MQHLTKNLSTTRAFSLLELAIVITMIGLLTGAIVAGKSYIRNARLNTSVNEAKYYLGALNQFETRYGAIPGDMSTASNYWTGVGNGDGNGLIWAGTGNAQEFFLAFQHLAKAGLITGTYTGTNITGYAYSSQPGVNIATSAISNVGYWYWDLTDRFLSGNGQYFDGQYMHPLFAGAALPGFYDLPYNPYLRPLEAQKIDSKFDDGNPGLGWIRTPKGSDVPNCTIGDVATTATYNVSYSGIACARMIFTEQN